MYALTISLRVRDEADVARVRAASLDVVGPSRLEPGCLFFDVLFDAEDPLLVRFYEAYVDKAAFDTHLAAPHTRAWAEACMPWVDRSSVRLPESESLGRDVAPRTVVVFGASGGIGSEMVRLLAADPRCAEVRALTRSPTGASGRRLAAIGPSVRVLPFVLDDLEAVVDGASDAFIVAPLSDDMAAWHEQVARALAACGVEHVVKVSVTGARSPDSVPPPGRFPSLHWAGEEALRKAGLKTTVIRPTIFMQHLEIGTGMYVRGDDRVFLPTGSTGVAFLDRRDIAAFGHALLLSESAAAFRGQAHELTGPEPVSGARIAEILSAVRGSAVQHVDGEEAFVARCAELGIPDWGRFVYAEAADGWFSEIATGTFELVVGRKPNGFAVYATDIRYFLSP